MTDAAAGEPPAIVAEEPVRGGYPDPSVLALPGCEQIAWSGTTVLPRTPLGHLLGLELIEVSHGRVSYGMPLTPWLRDGEGRITSAVAAVVADAALAAGVVSALPPGHGRLATIDLSLHHVRGSLDDEDGLVATGGPYGPVGHGVVVAEVEVATRAGRPVARGLAHCRVFPPIDPLPAAPSERVAEEPPETPDPYQRPLDDAARSDPVSRLFGIAAEPEPGVFSMPATQWLCPAAPALQGGALVMFAQIAAERAATQSLGRPVKVTQMSAAFLRMAVPGSGRLTAPVRVAWRSHSLATATLDLLDAAGRKLASMSATFFDAAAGS